MLEIIQEERASRDQKKIRLKAGEEIAMIDDDADQIFITRRFLKLTKLDCRFSGFTSGLEFIEHLKALVSPETTMPALILLDLRMPAMNGFEVLQKLKQDDHSRHLRVVVFSNSNEPCDMDRAIELGADAYMIKPSGIEDFTKFFNSLMVP